AGADHEPLAAVAGPGRLDSGAEVLGGGEPAAARAVHAHEVGVAEIADRARPVLLAAAPEVAPREAAKHRRAARLTALALQGQEDLLDRVAHGASSGRPASTHAFQPLARSSQAGQSPQP